MLGEPNYSINDLFAQLGLDSSDEAIDNFIEANKLSADEELVNAKIWSDKQRMFLQEEWKRDAVWVEIIDELNVRMHPTA
ncbi:DUF2789 family protein [Psychrobacter sp. M13]|uniref:DUF2789 family protein n=1 Tax=Psychrobacter sp. M13 TaxID=3067275 RepID=UPI00191A9E7C|nr:DUF2789 family protein [Psychrobacter sp. M13]WLP94052.1 DUF2789 family protein [Psychrobacter sp. M13]